MRRQPWDQEIAPWPSWSAPREGRPVRDLSLLLPPPSSQSSKHVLEEFHATKKPPSKSNSSASHPSVTCCPLRLCPGGCVIWFLRMISIANMALAPSWSHATGLELTQSFVHKGCVPAWLPASPPRCGFFSRTAFPGGAGVWLLKPQPGQGNSEAWVRSGCPCLKLAVGS